MRTHYCHNCRYHAVLIDGWHCGFCLTFFYANSRMPMASDKSAPRSTPDNPRPAIDRLWAEIDGR